jgi:haloalkane dehalogenase
MFWAEPGRVSSVEKAKEIETGLKNVRSVDIGPGTHYLQEDNPQLVQT